ncbi:MAG TPA: hypothetical protein PLB18_21385, partial [Acidobacteriota bacterium]|nr:hypothetical protein [Acidobacteriota bacterium]
VGISPRFVNIFYPEYSALVCSRNARCLRLNARCAVFGGAAIRLPSDNRHRLLAEFTRCNLIVNKKRVCSEKQTLNPLSFFLVLRIAKPVPLNSGPVPGQIQFRLRFHFG